MNESAEPRPGIRIRIRDLRRERSLTQEELADALGISRQSVNAMEAGRTLPSLPMAMQIAQYFDVPLNTVFLVDLQDGTLLPVLAAPKPAAYTGPANLWETERAYIVEFLVPGLRHEDLQLDIGDDLVTLRALAPRITTDYQLVRREFSPQSYTRTIRLPTPIRTDAAKAQLQGGVLRVLLPKLSAADGPSTRITIEPLD